MNYSILITLYNNLVLSKYEKQFYLHLAIQKGCANIVEILLENNADINTTTKGSTALHLAPLKGNEKTVAVLLENNADINATSIGS